MMRMPLRDSKPSHFGGPWRKTNKLVKIMNDSFYDLPCPINLNAWWSFGSMLGLCLVIQLVSGLLLSIHYTADESMAFDSVIHIMRDVKKGWMLRNIHANGSSMFFMCIYAHIGRGLYYGSYLDKTVWFFGVHLLLLTMAEAFLGYTLPWGQMSYWGATVITNMLSVIPVVGTDMLRYVWGGWTVCNATLKRFYTLHFLLPFVMIAFVALHLFFLHEKGSNNPLGIESDSMCVPFHPFYTVKDLFGYVCFMFVFMYLVCVKPEMLGNSLNYWPANPMKTPIHVQPEWYFMFAYAILRSIPHKASGVSTMFMAIVVLYFVPALHTGRSRSLSFYPVNQILFWGLIGTFITLTWIGCRPVREPYIFLGQVFTVSYFSLMLLNPVSLWMWDSIIYYPRSYSSVHLDVKWWDFLSIFMLLKFVKANKLALMWSKKATRW
uniref:Cytochrome b n=1 Tax=Mytilus californianus TaxID=6549 RepID=J9RTB8_MYTCA|nr:cytochrome b [Mytilus californianus]